MLITFQINIVTSLSLVLYLPQQRPLPGIIHALDLLFILAQLLISSLLTSQEALLVLLTSPAWLDNGSELADNNEWLGRPGLSAAC